MKYYIRLKINDNVRYEKDALILIYTYLFFQVFFLFFYFAKVATILLIIVVISKLSAFLNIFVCDLSDRPGYITNFEPIVLLSIMMKMHIWKVVTTARSVFNSFNYI